MYNIFVAKIQEHCMYKQNKDPFKPSKPFTVKVTNTVQSQIGTPNTQ